MEWRKPRTSREELDNVLRTRFGSSSGREDPVEEEEGESLLSGILVTKTTRVVVGDNTLTPFTVAGNYYSEGVGGG